MATGVRATGLKSFRVEVSGFLRTGITVQDLNRRGITACDRDWLKMSVYTPARCSAQASGLWVRLRQESGFGKTWTGHSGKHIEVHQQI